MKSRACETYPVFEAQFQSEVFKTRVNTVLEISCPDTNSSAQGNRGCDVPPTRKKFKLSPVHPRGRGVVGESGKLSRGHQPDLANAALPLGALP